MHSLSLASVKSRLVLPFWYWLTRVVLEKGPLNGCVCVPWLDIIQSNNTTATTNTVTWVDIKKLERPSCYLANIIIKKMQLLIYLR